MTVLFGWILKFSLSNPVLNLFLWNLQMSCFCSTLFGKLVCRGIFQGCIVVHFSRFKFCSLLLLSAATLLSYHRCFALSTTFLNFFQNFLKSCPLRKYHFSRWSLIISHQRFICQQLFQFIFYVAVILSDWIFSLNRTFTVYLKLFHLSTENFILFNISGCCYFSSTYYRRKRTLWWKKMGIHKNPLSLNLEDLLLVA